MTKPAELHRLGALLESRRGRVLANDGARTPRCGVTAPQNSAHPEGLEGAPSVGECAENSSEQEIGPPRHQARLLRSEFPPGTTVNAARGPGRRRRPGGGHGDGRTHGVAVWPAGCATGKMARDKSQRVSDPDRQRATNECVRASLTVSDSGELFMPYLVDRDVYARCMEARGYPTITR
jgi:hypothetical protein